MCNISAYVGNKNATEVILKMIKQQEGIDCGFYTGIAVHDGENLNYCKTVGDLETLLNTTNAKNLKGNVGIGHSRTPSGGGKEWAHPFYSYDNGVLKQCYVANGWIGCFKENNSSYDEIANDLYNEGYDFPSKEYTGSNLFNKLSNGASVHLSDIMCQLIFKYKRSGIDTLSAMTKAYYEIPKEIVGLLIEKETPTAIYFSRINMPMFVGFDESGAYLASSPTAFPLTVKSFKLLPALSSGVVYKDRVEIKKYKKFHEKVRGFNLKTVENACNLVMQRIKRERLGFNEIRDCFTPLLKGSKITQANVITYLCIYKLLSENKIDYEYATQTADGLVAPKTYFRLK